MFTLSPESRLPDLLEANREWAQDMSREHPQLFPTNGRGQQPHTLLISCSDSRYNENCFGVLPGEVFTWKSIANICRPEDLATCATLEFAIDVLGVSRVVLCGHTDCGGVNSCVRGQMPQLERNCPHLAEHLSDVVETSKQYASELAEARDPARLLCIRNAEKQYVRLTQNKTVSRALAEGRIQVYALLYNVDTGLVEKLASTE
ncbi:NCE103 (YNL036W) [Zygosaccharomyces parabailii]|nr:NCE103 (YNL036W) [Zygosaccharomyces parabailii]CDH12894.1 related to Carbonic anhydrase [Zygosaccharomyces bailii ISA1307]